jgi:DNA-binding SARP family transcriptional activator
MSAADDATLRLQVLGPVKAWRGEAEVDLGSGHPRTVLAALALSPNRAVSREELIDAVWGEAPPASAHGSIYTYVCRLRRALEPGRAKGSGRTGRSGPQLLASAGAGYCLRLDPEHIDAHRFDLLRDRAARHWREADLPAALGALDDALRLWHGDALSGLAGLFAAAQRARLAELRLATVERRVEVLLASGAHGELVAELRSLANEHPFRETLHGLLMRALDRGGRRTAALAVFADVRDRLVETAGTEPGPALRRLHEQILADCPAPERPRRAASVPAPSLPPRPGTFFGREAELGTLREAVSGAMDGHGGSLMVEGEPGIGKSALLAEAFADVTGCRIAWGAAAELDQRFPLRPVLDALGGHARSVDARLAELASSFEDRGADAIDDVVELVRVLCAEGPLLFVLDDLQWADEMTVRAWRRLAREARSLPLLLVGACRPIPRPPELERLRAGRAESGMGVLALGPLPEQAARALAKEIAGASPAWDLRLLAGYAAGNPLYLREIVQTLIDGDMVRVEGGRAWLGGSCTRVPSPLASRVSLHLSFLSPQTRDTLRWAALLGLEFSLADLAVALERPATDLAGAVEEAIASGVLIESGGRLAFRHPLLHRVLYEKTGAAMRIALHRQLAEALATAGAPASRVAEQLAAGPVQVDSWVGGWLLANIDAVAAETPRVAVGLVGVLRAEAQASLGGPAREALTTMLARLLLLRDREPNASALPELATGVRRESHVSGLPARPTGMLDECTPANTA